MIRFDHVSKQFTMRYENSRTFQDIFVKTLGKLSGTAPHSTRPSAVKILDDVSFTVGGGEALGIIGPNGAGKSTILKLAAGIIYPDTGRISIEGRVAGLLELGAGFHPDLSGRENIYLYGSIMGLSRKTIETRLAEIVEFAGLSHFIDIPVRDYSSGMFMRLAFAVAIHVDADILLIDEVLSVGDAEFRQRSYRRVLDYKASGGTILFVSHEMGAVQSLCDRVIVLKNGRIALAGEPEEGIKYYYHTLSASADAPANAAEITGEGTRSLKIEHVELVDRNGDPVHTLQSGEETTIRIFYKADGQFPVARCGVQIWGRAREMLGDMVAFYDTNTAVEGLPSATISGEGSFEVHYPALTLSSGEYFLRVAIYSDSPSQEIYADKFQAYKFRIISHDLLTSGFVDLPHRWLWQPGDQRQE